MSTHKETLTTKETIDVPNGFSLEGTRRRPKKGEWYLPELGGIPQKAITDFRNVPQLILIKDKTPEEQILDMFNEAIGDRIQSGDAHITCIDWGDQFHDGGSCTIRWKNARIPLADKASDFIHPRDM